MQFVTSQSPREEFTMEESLATHAEHSSDETLNERSFLYAKERENVLLLILTGSNALHADMTSVSGLA